MTAGRPQQRGKVLQVKRIDSTQNKQNQNKAYNKAFTALASVDDSPSRFGFVFALVTIPIAFLPVIMFMW
jgi:hypothetical protein